MKSKIAIVYGGKSPEHEVSCDSAAAIIKELKQSEYEIIPLYITKNGNWQLRFPESKTEGELVFPLVGQGAFLTESKKRLEPNIIFPIVHGKTGEDGILQGLFELMDLPYSGCGVLSSAIGMNKALVKDILGSCGIKVLPHILINNQTNINKVQVEKLGYPIFVKPLSQGSSIGISKVSNASGLSAAIKQAFKFDTQIMLEKGIDHAREFVCGVLGDFSSCCASQIGEVCIMGGHEFYDYSAKYLDERGMRLDIPARLQAWQEEYIKKSALNAFCKLGCSGFARVDFLADRKSGDIWLCEINTAPGFTSHSLYPALWKSSGVPVLKLIERIIKLAENKYKSKKAFQ